MDQICLALNTNNFKTKVIFDGNGFYLNDILEISSAVGMVRFHLQWKLANFSI